MRKARAVRERLGLTLADVMRNTTVDGGHLSRFERGEDEMSTRRIQQLVNYYNGLGAGTSLGELVAEDNAEPEQAGDEQQRSA